jgi:hypothetical protein
MSCTESYSIISYTQRERNNVAHTAFAVVAMKEYVDTFGGRGTPATMANEVRTEI